MRRLTLIPLRSIPGGRGRFEGGGGATLGSRGAARVLQHLSVDPAGTLQNLVKFSSLSFSLSTEWTKYYHKSVLHMLTRTWNMRLRRYSTDLH